MDKLHCLSPGFSPDTCRHHRSIIPCLAGVIGYAAEQYGAASGLFSPSPWPGTGLGCGPYSRGMLAVCLVCSDSALRIVRRRRSGPFSLARGGVLWWHERHRQLCFVIHAGQSSCACVRPLVLRRSMPPRFVSRNCAVSLSSCKLAPARFASLKSAPARMVCPWFCPGGVIRVSQPCAGGSGYSGHTFSGSRAQITGIVARPSLV